MLRPRTCRAEEPELRGVGDRRGRAAEHRAVVDRFARELAPSDLRLALGGEGLSRTAPHEELALGVPDAPAVREATNVGTRTILGEQRVGDLDEVGVARVRVQGSGEGHDPVAQRVASGAVGPLEVPEGVAEPVPVVALHDLDERALAGRILARLRRRGDGDVPALDGASQSVHGVHSPVVLEGTVAADDARPLGVPAAEPRVAEVVRLVERDVVDEGAKVSGAGVGAHGRGELVGVFHHRAGHAVERVNRTGLLLVHRQWGYAVSFHRRFAFFPSARDFAMASAAM
jgi:hypothetical protein